MRYQNNPMIRNKQPGNLAFTVSYSIAQDSKQKAAAWTLLTYLTGKQGMGTWTSKGLALPSRSDVKPVAGREAFSGRHQLAAVAVRARLRESDRHAGNELTAVFENKQNIPDMLSKVQAEGRKDAFKRGR